MTIQFSGASANNVRHAPRRMIDTRTDVEPGAPLVGEGGIEAPLPETRGCEEPSEWPTNRQPSGDFLDGESDPGVRLKHLISRQAEAVAQARGTMPVFFAGDGFPCEAIVKRRKWSRQLEEQWADVVGACMRLGYLDKGDTLITARLILGMIISAAKQCQPAAQISAEQITHAVVTLLRL
jgi:Tetracyclin repressor-like, C-terminal domain